MYGLKLVCDWAREARFQGIVEQHIAMSSACRCESGSCLQSKFDGLNFRLIRYESLKQNSA